MLKYRASDLVRAGFIGVVLAILIIAVGLQPERLLAYATSLQYKALFSEAGGITVGNDVT
jgi:phospholipid/cholesterol/gamma-HCH transport system substrate-binding protein